MHEKEPGFYQLHSVSEIEGIEKDMMNFSSKAPPQ